MVSFLPHLFDRTSAVDITLSQLFPLPTPTIHPHLCMCTHQRWLGVIQKRWAIVNGRKWQSTNALWPTWKDYKERCVPWFFFSRLEIVDEETSSKSTELKRRKEPERKYAVTMCEEDVKKMFSNAIFRTFHPKTFDG